MTQFINVYENPHWARFISASRLSELSEDLHEHVRSKLECDISLNTQSLIGNTQVDKVIFIGVVSSSDFIANQLRNGGQVDSACSTWKKLTEMVLTFQKTNRKNIKLFEIKSAIANPQDFCTAIEYTLKLNRFPAQSFEDDLFSIVSEHLAQTDVELNHLNLLLRASVLPIPVEANRRDCARAAASQLAQMVEKQSENKDEIELLLSQLFYTQEQLEVYYHQGRREEKIENTRCLDLISELRVRATKAEYEQKMLKDDFARIRRSVSWKLTKPIRFFERLFSRHDVPGHAEFTHQAKLIAGSKYFDSDWYLETYQDVASAHANPIEHYLRFGGQEGRSPGPLFDANWYMNKYPDVRENGANPLLHYILFGESEGREMKALSATTN